MMPKEEKIQNQKKPEEKKQKTCRFLKKKNPLAVDLGEKDEHPRQQKKKKNIDALPGEKKDDALKIGDLKNFRKKNGGNE